eukprot:g44822.t1
MFLEPALVVLLVHECDQSLSFQLSCIGRSLIFTFLAIHLVDILSRRPGHFQSLRPNTGYRISSAALWTSRFQPTYRFNIDLIRFHFRRATDKQTSKTVSMGFSNIRGSMIAGQCTVCMECHEPFEADGGLVCYACKNDTSWRFPKFFRNRFKVPPGSYEYMRDVAPWIGVGVKAYAFASVSYYQYSQTWNANRIDSTVFQTVRESSSSGGLLS